MIPLTLRQVAEAVGAEISTPSGPSDNTIISRVCTDSREIQPGDLFVAIRGPIHNGHDHVEEAIDSGAVACLVERVPLQQSRDRKGAGQASNGDLQQPLKSSGTQMKSTQWRAGPALRVDDTVAALGRLAAWYRRDVLADSTRVIAVTGSNGKTTTKQMIHHLLSGSIKGVASPKSFNNHFGVPLTLLSADPDHQYVVAELGTSAPGEIALLARMASPDLAVITSIGEAHLEGLMDINSIVAEKSALIDHVRPGGLALVNVDRLELRRRLRMPTHARLMTFGFDASADERIVPLSVGLAGTTFILGGRHRIELNIPGLHHASNAVAAWLVGRSFGLPAHDMIERLTTFKPSSGRACLRQLNGVTVVDDAYNANPSSMLAAVETLKSASTHRRVLVMGDMLELGDQSAAMHEKVVNSAIASGIEVLLAVGEQSARAAQALAGQSNGTTIAHCVDAFEATKTLVPLLHPGDCVWVKGSRAIGLDRVVRDLEAALHSDAGG